MANLLRLHPELRRRMEAMVDELRREGYEATVTSGYRSFKEQAALQKLHLLYPDEYPFPVARPGCSTHNFGIAFDLVTDLPPGNRDAFADYFGLVWAGDRDPVHYDLVGFDRWRQLLHQAGIC